MKHMNYKIESLLREGFSMKTLENFSDDQIGLLYEKVKKGKKPKSAKKCSCGCEIEKCTCGPSCECGCYDKNKKKVGEKTKKEPKEAVTTSTTTATTKKVTGDDAQQGTKENGLIKLIPGGYEVTNTNEGEIKEKSVSKKQRGLMGAAYGVEKGKQKLSDIPKSYRKKVKDIVDSMTKKELRKFAKTKEDDLPEKVSENDEIKQLEESIIKLIKSYKEPVTTKSELLNYIRNRK